MNSQNTKVYLGIVEEIRQLITNSGLLPGDKIPSERTLSEQLQVGRSSVREALRALELLGLIETRRGEGTFLRDFKNHDLIRLLGMFILQEPEVKKDIFQTKVMLERDMLILICKQPDRHQLSKILREMASRNDLGPGEFFERLLETSGNRLMFRMWQIIRDYSKEAEVNRYFGAEELKGLIEAAMSGNSNMAISIHHLHYHQSESGG
ncbi:MAG TPA: GntR family transcriptional regulator [Bacillaceae bacterium]